MFPALPWSHFLHSRCAHVSCGPHRPSCGVCTALVVPVMMHVIHYLRARAGLAMHCRPVPLSSSDNRQGRTSVRDEIRSSKCKYRTMRSPSSCPRTIYLIPFFPKDYTPSPITLALLSFLQTDAGPPSADERGEQFVPRFGKYIESLDVCPLYVNELVGQGLLYVGQAFGRPLRYPARPGVTAGV